MSRGLACAILLLALCGDLTASETATNDTREAIRRYKGMTLDQLLDEPVVTPSRSAQSISSTPSSVQIITSEEIRHSPAKTLPESLRLAPNLQVARASSSSWAISARGFNNTLANKMLVMIDGRTVYTPLFAGVFWDVQNVLLEDVERIEVVSGPGGSLWGANAVNGIINVISKSAKDTQGTYASASAGTFLQDSATARYGGGNGSNFFYRVYGQRFDFNSTIPPPGTNANTPDRMNMNFGGLRMDWQVAEADALMAEANFYGGTEQGGPGSTLVDGQNIVGRWTRDLGLESTLQAQMYFDRTWRRIPDSIGEDLKTYDLDVQHEFPLGERQHVVWGGGYRLMQDRIDNSPAIAFLPPRKNLQLFSGFIQDEIMLARDYLKLSLGAKLEHNDYSGIEVQPSIRLAWTPDDRQTVWAAVSRAVRSPSRIDTDVQIFSPPSAASVSGGAGFDSEKLLAFELGYRSRPFEPLWLSISTYYNFYDDLRSLDLVSSNSYVLANHYRGEVWGVELSAEYFLARWWRLRGGYNYLHKNLWPHGASDVIPGVREGDDPQHQFSIQSIMELPANFQFDMTARYTSQLPSPLVPSYLSVNARLAWQYKHAEFSIVGENLNDPGHVEFGTRSIPRSMYGKVTLRF